MPGSSANVLHRSERTKHHDAFLRGRHANLLFYPVLARELNWRFPRSPGYRCMNAIIPAAILISEIFCLVVPKSFAIVFSESFEFSRHSNDLTVPFDARPVLFGARRNSESDLSIAGPVGHGPVQPGGGVDSSSRFSVIVLVFPMVRSPLKERATASYRRGLRRPLYRETTMANV